MIARLWWKGDRTEVRNGTVVLRGKPILSANDDGSAILSIT
jgi:hypothetical protein